MPVNPGERELLHLISAIYDAALEPERWSTLLEDLCAAFGATAALIITALELEAPEIWSVRFDLDCLVARLRQLAALEVTAGVKAGATLPLRQIMNDSGIMRSPAARAALLDQGLFHSALSPLEHVGPLTAMLGVFRPKAAGAFDRADIERLGLLTPHLARTLAFQRRARAADLRQRQTEQALDQLGVGFLLLADGGQVRYANHAARTILSDRSGISLRHGRLVAQRSCDAPRLAMLLAGAEGRKRAPRVGGAICVPRWDGRPPLQVWAMPLAIDAGGAAPLDPQATHCLMLIDPERTPAVLNRTLQSLWGLTTAEARLTRALLAGQRLEDHAAQANISMNTARTHLKSIFAKTQISRQADLIRLLSRAPVVPDEK